MGEALIVLAFFGVSAVGLDSLVCVLQPQASRLVTLLVAAGIVPLGFAALSIRLFVDSWLAPPSECGVDACGMAMAFAMFGMAFAIAGFAVGIISVALARRFIRRI